ncbi:hypothetical protein [Clostridium sp. YIM B02555]|uniref:hypothetical protein n=1 Tax=Clostridium sp. YIM B02555 TaxID=2911968 RepID=UPI001EEE8798|nr:hypothetical protein [Clostridium sp. YIM B02555]
MNIDRKKELLLLVDSIAKDIRNDNCGNYTPKIINAIEIAKKYNDINKFEFVLKKLKSSTFGGNSEKEGYGNFVDNIVNKREYKINSLSFEELEFVFSWVGRIIKTKKSNENYDNKNKNFNARNKNNNYHNNNFNKSNTNKYNNEKTKSYSPVKSDSNEGLNSALAEQLMKWKSQ